MNKTTEAYTSKNSFNDQNQMENENFNEYILVKKKFLKNSIIINQLI